MMHLTEDQIYHLVEAIGNRETLTAEEEQLLVFFCLSKRIYVEFLHLGVLGRSHPCRV